MNHLIVGYGYCGKYLAQTLIKKNQQVTTWSRSSQNSKELSTGHTHQTVNVSTDHFNLPKECEIIHYLIAPPDEGQTDKLLENFLTHIKQSPKHIIYYGSSGIYGDHQGKLIDETSSLNLKSDRQYRRHHAEQQLIQFCRKNNIKLSILRIAGIYGPGRIPLEKVEKQSPIITPSEAPITNRIYVQDLVEIAEYLCRMQIGIECYNISDGNPSPMGYTQQKLCERLDQKPSPQISFQDYLKKASPMQQEFLSSSKQLDTNKIKKILGGRFTFTSLKAGLKLANNL